MSTDMVMSKLVVKLIIGLKRHTRTPKKGKQKTVFIKKLNDLNQVKLQEAYKLKKQQQQQQRHWNSDNCNVRKENQKTRISDLRGFWKKVGL